jgi:hypothetical protein
MLRIVLLYLEVDVKDCKTLNKATSSTSYLNHHKSPGSHMLLGNHINLEAFLVFVDPGLIQR